ncbi:MAG: GGDEF domain-containing protein [Thalassolituus sp.]|uniref:GGDEF domain-containing protein n=1 Tax=Thalassolituus sp. TaxID=2030822 RepID=UPI00398285E1
MNLGSIAGIVHRLRSGSIPNPMDWRAIDRYILLSALVFLAPACFGISLWVTNVLAPEYLNQSLVPYMLWMYGIHILVLIGFIVEAFHRRHYADDWPFFESFIIGSYIVVILISGYLTGSHFTEGLLLIFLGVNITCTLANVNKIRFCYWLVMPTLLVMGIADFIPSVPYAILLEKPLILPDGHPVLGWLIVRALIVFILALLIYLCILAMKRWTERESLYQEMSTIDGLTRLSNRNFFINRGEEEIERAQKQHAHPMSPLACIMIDLDHFKRINDKWGHHAGDEVLVTASKIMMDNARRNDEVGRYGGEEFAILLPNTNIKTAERIAERLRVKISETQVMVDGEIINVTASFGVACYPSDGVSGMGDLLKTADKALYEAKETGRNKVVVACCSDKK